MYISFRSCTAIFEAPCSWNLLDLEDIQAKAILRFNELLIPPCDFKEKEEGADADVDGPVFPSRWQQVIRISRPRLTFPLYCLLH
jgi:hypothetical protein